MNTRITVRSDEFGTYRYEFQHEGKTFECFDFSTESDAFEGARFHLHCLHNKLRHDVCDGIGAIYRPDDYGYDPVGDGTFKMIPSGRIVTREELSKWQATRKKSDVRNDCFGLSWDEIERKQGGKLTREGGAK